MNYDNYPHAFKNISYYSEVIIPLNTNYILIPFCYLWRSAVDIRYCLFIIDKFVGASNLVEEMTIKK